MNGIAESEKYLLNVYKRIPIQINHGDGVWLYDDKGNKYLDFLAGIAVNALGYNHTSINQAIAEQHKRNLHLSNFFVQDVQVALAKKLISLSRLDKVFFSNSGTEAIEGLLKLVKKWGRELNKSKIISFRDSFHGRTLGAVTITGQEKYQKNFRPLLPNVEILPFNDVEVFQNAVGDDTCAIFFEGVQGEGGIRPISGEMLEAIKGGREIYNYLIIVDEIQTGVGRTGKFFFYENFDFMPDAIASAKGLGGGLPLGAFLVSERLADVFVKGDHGTTYGGNPLACATGLATVDIVSEPDFLENVTKMGNYFCQGLNKLKSKFPKLIAEVRGHGLMLGLEVMHSATEIMDIALENKLIFNLAGGGTTLRFVPPLIIQKNDIDFAVEALNQTFSTLKIN